jgi:hypothetical protein
MLNFPNAPTVGQVFGSYTWDGEKWVQTISANTLAPLASPVFTGDPQAPTPSPGDSDTSVATTSFVAAAIAANGAPPPPATVAPLMDGAAAVGATTKYAREDHIHPSDTSRASLASPALTGVPTAPTASVGTSTTQLATTAFVSGAVTAAGSISEAPNDGQYYSRRNVAWAVSPGGLTDAPNDGTLYGRQSVTWAPIPIVAPATVAPLMNGTAAVGTSIKYAREDHVHPADTSVFAPIASPVFTGDPKSVTPTAGDNDTSIATSAFVQNMIARAIVPGGRLTLTLGTPVMSSNVTNSSAIYYVSHTHGSVPVYDGTSWSLVDIGAGLTNATADVAINPAPVAVNSIYDLFVWNSAGSPRLSRGPLWTSSSARSLGLARVNGIWTNASAISNGPLTNRGTWVGTILSNGAALIDWVRGSNAAGGGTASLNLWNANNRVDVKTVVGDTTASWTYNSAVWRSANNSAANSVKLVVGGNDEDIEARYSVASQDSASIGTIPLAGVGVDSTSAMSGYVQPGGSRSAGTAQVYGTATGTYVGKLAIGTHTINAIESGLAAVSVVTFYGISASGNQAMGLNVNLRM